MSDELAGHGRVGVADGEGGEERPDGVPRSELEPGEVDVPVERLRSRGQAPRSERALANPSAEADDGSAGSASSLARPVEYPSERPTTRAACLAMPRPCPFVSCVYHLYLEVDERTGAIRYNFPGRPVDQLAQTCVLDVAELGGLTLAETGALINLSRERIYQLESRVLDKLRSDSVARELESAEGPAGWEASEPGGLEDL